MAGRAHGGRKARGNVVRYAPADRGGALPGRLVAAITIRVRCGEVVIIPGMAIGASHYFAGGRQLMRAGQRPARDRVIERDVGPEGRVVAGRAIRCRKWGSRRRMCWVVGLLPGGQVTL